MMVANLGTMSLFIVFVINVSLMLNLEIHQYTFFFSVLLHYSTPYSHPKSFPIGFVYLLSTSCQL